MSNQTRYTILLDAPTVATLNDLQGKLSLSTRAAVFDLALVVLDWVAKQEEDGYEVGREKEGNFQPLLLPVKRRPVPAPRVESVVNGKQVAGRVQAGAERQAA